MGVQERILSPSESFVCVIIHDNSFIENICYIIFCFIFTVSSQSDMHKLFQNISVSPKIVDSSKRMRYAREGDYIELEITVRADPAPTSHWWTFIDNNQTTNRTSRFTVCLHQHSDRNDLRYYYRTRIPFVYEPCILDIYASFK